MQKITTEGLGTLPPSKHPWQVMRYGDTLILANLEHPAMRVVKVGPKGRLEVIPDRACAVGEKG